MFFICFLITFNYNILRTMKDTLVVTAASSGAEVIPFIKVWVMFPGSLLLTYVFVCFSNRMRWEKVVYAMMGIFLLYFVIFTFILYPARDSLHPNKMADVLQEILPLGFKGFIAMFRNWTLTSFYVMSELWGNIILSLLFWGFLNQVTRLHEAKRFYAIFGVGGNLSGILAGQLSVFLCRSDFCTWLPFGSDDWEQTLTILLSLVIFNGIVALVLFRWMNVKVLSDPRYYDPEDAKDEKSMKGKLSFMDNLSILLKSKYMFGIALCMIAYNVSINLVEVVWKDQIRQLYPNPRDYNLYFNQVSTIIGVVATFSALFISGNSIRKFGWTFTALLTPIILLLTSFGFFGFYFSKEHLIMINYTLFGMTPLAIVVFFGSLQNILCRAAKYTVYDTTKEMALLPLNSALKLKGKAAIDGVCNRLGKSGGSVVHSGLLIMFSTITAGAPYVSGFLFCVIAVWLHATRSLGNQFNILSASGRKKNLDDIKGDIQPSQQELEPVLTRQTN